MYHLRSNYGPPKGGRTNTWVVHDTTFTDASQTVMEFEKESVN